MGGESAQKASLNHKYAKLRQKSSFFLNISHKNSRRSGMMAVLINSQRVSWVNQETSHLIPLRLVQLRLILVSIQINQKWLAIMLKRLENRIQQFIFAFLKQNLIEPIEYRPNKSFRHLLSVLTISFFNNLTYIMIRNLRLAFAISHLSYAPRTIPLIEKFQQSSPSHSAFSLLNFRNTVSTPSIFSRAFNSKTHAELLQLYLSYIEKGEERPQGIAFQSIEENLRRTVIRQLQQKQIKISIDKFNVFESQLIEETIFRGVFIHRSLNLNSSAYDIKPHNNASVSFEMKKSLRSESVQEYQRIIRAYSRDKMDEIYCSGYDEFKRNKQITRRIYRITADIALTISKNGGKERLGDEPTEHLIQVESVFNRYYNMDEFFITDVDFLLKGNYFLNKLA